jgi:CRISPR-associated protein Csx16
MTAEPAKIHRLVTFLGTGSYQPTTYALGERRAETTRFVCRALAELLQPAEIVVLATEQAERTHGPALKEALHGKFPSPEFEPIPFGENSEQLWRQFEIIKMQLRGGRRAVMLDITHGFRSSPFFAAAVVSFVRTVDESRPEFRVCYAGALGATGEGVTPIWELSEFVTLLDWTSALMLFLRTGRAEEAAIQAELIGHELRRAWVKAGRPGTEPPLKELGDSLRQFGKDLETLRTGDLLIGRKRKTSSAARLLTAATDARQAVIAHTPALADVLDRIVAMVRPLAGERMDLSGTEGRNAVAALAETYFRLGRYLEATATIREGWINFYAPKAVLSPGAPGFDAKERKRIEDQASEIDHVFREVTDRRNDLAHAQYRPSAQGADGIIRKVGELVEKFRAASHARCFVNLSNHPSAGWKREQIEAALALGEHVVDVEFPKVPPGAAEENLPAIAEECVRQIPIGTTHALVQGEFTLAFEIVRRLQEQGIACVAATTEREVEEAGEGRKTSRFRFVRFRGYPPLVGRQLEETAPNCDPDTGQQPLTSLQGSGRGLWGKDSARTVRRPRDEWDR